MTACRNQGMALPAKPCGFHHEGDCDPPDLTWLDSQLETPDVSDIPVYSEMSTEDLLTIEGALDTQALLRLEGLSQRTNEGMDIDNIRRGARAELDRRLR